LRGQGSRGAAERRCGPVSKEVGSRRRGRGRALGLRSKGAVVGSPGAEGCQSGSPGGGSCGSFAAQDAGLCVRAFGFGCGAARSAPEMFEPSGSGGFEDPRRGQGKLWRAKTQERNDLRRGATRVGCERTHAGRNASKRVKLAERDGSVDRDPGGPGRTLRRLDGEPIVAGGTQAAARERGCRVKPAVTRPRDARSSASVDNRKGATGLERGARSG
jgi:hypothetical protein